MRRLWMIALAAAAVLALAAPALADYTLADGTKVEWKGGDMISINGGPPVRGIRVGDRLLPPSSGLGSNAVVVTNSSGGAVSPYQDLRNADRKQSGLAVISFIGPDGKMYVGTADIWGKGYSSVTANSTLGQALAATGAPVINGQVAISFIPGGAACQQTGNCQGSGQTSYSPWDIPTSSGHTITIRLPYGGGTNESGGGGGGSVSTTPVNITALTVSPDPSSEGDTITVTVTTDTPANSVQVGFDWPSGNQAIPLAMAGNNLTWSGTVTVPAGSAGTRTASAVAQNSVSVSSRGQNFTVLPPDSRSVTGSVEQPVARAGMVLNVSATVNGTADPNDPPSVITPWGATVPLTQGADGVWRASIPIPGSFGGGSYALRFQARLTQPPAYTTPKLVWSETFVTIMAQADLPPPPSSGGGQNNDIPDWWTPPQYGGTGGW